MSRNLSGHTSPLSISLPPASAKVTSLGQWVRAAATAVDSCESQLALQVQCCPAAIAWARVLMAVCHKVKAPATKPLRRLCFPTIPFGSRQPCIVRIESQHRETQSLPRTCCFGNRSPVTCFLRTRPMRKERALHKHSHSHTQQPLASITAFSATRPQCYGLRDHVSLNRF